MVIKGAIESLRSNPIFAGLVGTMAMGWVMWALRTVPMKIAHWAFEALTVTIVVSSDDGVFDWVNEWLSRHDYARSARRLKLSTGRANAEEWTLAPGFGLHLLWDRGPVLIERRSEDKPAGGFSTKARESFEITTLGRSQARIRELIERANDVRRREDNLGLRVWQTGWWQPLPSRSKRSMDSVFLPAEQKDEILRDAAWFFSARAWFAERGVPYRRGYLLFGMPRTGKSTLVTALASHFGRPIYIINLSTVKNDNELLSAFLAAAANAILLIEDVDCTVAAQVRKSVATTLPATPSDSAKAPETMPEGVTLSGLLNAIDGVTASEGRLLCMTTNHIGKLDPALIGEARIDKKFEIQPLTSVLVEEMARRFFPSRPLHVAALIDEARAMDPRPAAYWQDRMMEIEIDIPSMSARRERAA